ncbi:MAG: hypothetical protein EXR52_03360 [Dehalococcoidia bacterium]|nr:hypothetical protein [Dehalococcoidia bacterium]
MVPEIEDLYTPLTEQGQTLVRIKGRGLRKVTEVWSLSDGTLHTLGILAALYAPEPPDIMVFEEPENYVHPRVLDVLAEVFREASDLSQVLISTHSPYLLNLLEPEDIVVIEKLDGATRATPAVRKKGLKPALQALGLGEAWYSGSIGGIPE